MLEIRPITAENSEDLRLKNEPFGMPGRMIPRLEKGVWTYETEMFDHVQTMTFPEEAYTLDSLADGVLLGAYQDGTCVGLAIVQPGFFRYMYLYDLKVCAAARGQGVGRALIHAALEQAKARGFLGLYTIAQDNNLNACRFYLRTGFEIGGFDNHVYTGTSQQGKSDILFYTKG